MSTYDFRDQEPVWVRYAINTSGNHDKFYEVRVDFTDSGTFVLTKRWGRRPDAGGGQIKAEGYTTMSGATQAASAMLHDKLRGGYREVERPHGADNKVRRESGSDWYADEDAF